MPPGLAVLGFLRQYLRLCIQNLRIYAKICVK
jgi:hypothetical protein